jgi:hypothetical protein
MLSEEEVRERALYCYCVFLQLGCLHDNDLIEPHEYLEVLKKSSLQLGSDGFIAATIEEALMQGLPDGGLRALLALYEGFVHAYCEVLQISLDSLEKEISRDFLRDLGSEVGVKVR